MADDKPVSSNIIAVVFGASEFPDCPTMDSSPAFAASAEAFTDYLRSTLALPAAHLLSLFDEPLDPGRQVARMKQFIRERLSDNPGISDAIFYYCGHGGFLTEDEYVLALRCTNTDSKEATMFRMSYLVDVIGSLTQERRNLVVLDACYSGAALGEFAHMSEVDAVGTISRQIAEPLPEPAAEDGESGGVMLFCAAGPKKWAKSPLEAKLTMFTGALNAALREGDSKGGPHLSVKRLAELVQRRIRREYGSQAVQPQVHVPIQEGGLLIETPYFPNPAFGSSLTEARLNAVEADVRNIRNELTRMATAIENLAAGSASAATATESPGGDVEFSRNIVRLVNTFLVMFVLDMATYLLVSRTVGSIFQNKYGTGNELTTILAICVVVHVLLLILSVGGVFANYRLYKEKHSLFLEFFRTKMISFLALAWNSAAIILALGILLLAPASLALGIFSPDDRQGLNGSPAESNAVAYNTELPAELNAVAYNSVEYDISGENAGAYVPVESNAVSNRH